MDGPETEKSKPKRKCSIYALMSGERILYVGSTVQSPQARFRQHITGLRQGTHANKMLSKVAMEMGIDTLEIVLIEMTDEDRRDEVEYKHIQEMTRNGIQLANILREPLVGFSAVTIRSFAEIPPDKVLSVMPFSLVFDQEHGWSGSCRIYCSDRVQYLLRVSRRRCPSTGLPSGIMCRILWTPWTSLSTKRKPR